MALVACSGEVGPAGGPPTGGSRTASTTATTGTGVTAGTGSGSSSTATAGGSTTGSNAASGSSSSTSSTSTSTSGAGGAGTGGTGAGGGSGTADDLQFCLDENNRYRATVGSAPLVRSSTLDDFAATGAQYDYDAMSAHKHFGDSKMIPGGATAAGENEIPGWGGWSIKSQGSVHEVLVGGLKAMWDEGPGGGHYENMKNPSYTKFGCGIYVAPNAEQDVTVTMDFTN
jgi:uncharacterized protein YkwD